MIFNFQTNEILNSMKKIHYIMNCLLAGVLLAGCSGAELPETVQPPHTAEGNVPLGVEAVSLGAEVNVTRAVSTVNSGSIGIFLTGTGYTAVNNRQYNYATPAWTPNGGVANTIYLGGGQAQVCAYHPWTAANSNSGAVALKSAVYAAANDLSYDKNHGVNGSSAGCSVAFAMTRAYSRIGFKFQRSNYPGTCTVSKLEIKNLLPAASLNITTGVYSATAGTNAATITATRNVTVPGTGTIDWGENYLLIPCPAPYSTGMEITLTVDGKPMTTTVTTASYKPVAGEYKTLTLTIKGADLKVSTVTTTDWVESSGSADFEI